MDDVDKFMRDKFADLGKTYLDSEPGGRRVLLGSIVPSGLVWQDSDLSNQVFSPSYQAILNPKPSDFALGDPTAFSIEPLTIWLTNLMDAYQKNKNLN